MLNLSNYGLCITNVQTFSKQLALSSCTLSLRADSTELNTNGCSWTPTDAFVVGCRVEPPARALQQRARIPKITITCAAFSPSLDPGQSYRTDRSSQFVAMYVAEVLAVLVHTVQQYWAVILALALLAYVVKQRYFAPLSHLPGPWLAGLTRGWFVWHSLRGKQHLVHLECHRKYGPLWRASPNFVLVNDPQYIQTVYKWARSDWYDAFTVETDYIATGMTLDIEAHNWKRKRVYPAVRY
jgi:hypothetical protein